MEARTIGIVLYAAILLGIGVVASRRMKDIRDYYAAGKKLSFWSVAFSARATGESAWLLLGLTGMGAALGVKAFWVVAGEVLGVGAAWLLMARRFRRLTGPEHYDAVTVPDYLEGRFADTSKRLRTFAALALTVFVTIYVSAQIDATGQAFETFLGWNYYVGAIVGFGVVLVYLVTGGFLAVAWSDVFQGALMFAGLVVLPVVALGGAGGMDGVTAALTAADPNLLSWTGGAGITVLSVAGILSLLLIGLGFLGSPQIFVRFLAIRDENEIAKGATVALVWTVLADAGAVCIGLVGRAVLVDSGVDMTSVLGTGGEDVLPRLVEATFPSFIVGVYIAIVLSAIMSTVDSLLILASSAAVRDWHQKVRNPDLADDTLVGLSRTVTFGLAIAALAIAMGVAVSTPDRTIFWFVIFGWSGIAATFCPTMILSLYWKGMTANGALAAMVAGFAGVPLFKFVAPKLPVVGEVFGALGELPPAFALSFVVAILVSRMDSVGPPANASADLDAAAR
ncbi:MAG: sodium/proline symporter [Deltaproteobacteria bacterium]|nr:sodium/proline symporter [Deltaproteobacteria bacterium]